MSEYKRGDIIVSGLGNIGIFTDTWNDDRTFCDRLTTYGTYAGTDVKYMRKATPAECDEYFRKVRNFDVWNEEDKELYLSVKKDMPRFQPTLQEFRNCYDGFKTLKADNERLRKQVDPVRQENSALVVEKENMRKEYEAVYQENERLLEDIAKLKKTIDAKNREIRRITKESDEASKEYYAELERLRNRSLWNIIFGR